MDFIKLRIWGLHYSDHISRIPSWPSRTMSFSLRILRRVLLGVASSGFTLLFWFFWFLLLVLQFFHLQCYLFNPFKLILNPLNILPPLLYLPLILLTLLTHNLDLLYCLFQIIQLLLEVFLWFLPPTDFIFKILSWFHIILLLLFSLFFLAFLFAPTFSMFFGLCGCMKQSLFNFSYSFLAIISSRKVSWRYIKLIEIV